MRFKPPLGYEGRPPREWPVPEMDHAAGWKASAFSWEMGALILARIAAGETVRQVTADPRMPAYCTVYRWVRVHEDFAEAWFALRRELAREAIVADAQARADAAALTAFRESLGIGRKRRGGRRSTYTREAGRKVCRAVANGAALYKAVRAPGMPSLRAIYRWLKAEPAFREAYVAACRTRLDMLQHDIWLAVDRSMEGGDHAEAKAEVAYLEGRQGRLVPKKYRALPT